MGKHRGAIGITTATTLDFLRKESEFQTPNGIGHWELGNNAPIFKICHFK